MGIDGETIDGILESVLLSFDRFRGDKCDRGNVGLIEQLDGRASIFRQIYGLLDRLGLGGGGLGFERLSCCVFGGFFRNFA
jgi:hypothetical protein